MLKGWSIDHPFFLKFKINIMTKEKEEQMAEQLIQLGMEISKLQGENEILKQQNTELLKLLSLTVNKCTTKQS